MYLLEFFNLISTFTDFYNLVISNFSGHCVAIPMPPPPEEKNYLPLIIGVVAILLIAFGILFGFIFKKLRNNHIDFNPLPSNDEVQDPIIQNDEPNLEDNTNAAERVVSRLGSMSRLRIIIRIIE